jgi:hypothetical protein
MSAGITDELMRRSGYARASVKWLRARPASDSQRIGRIPSASWRSGLGWVAPAFKLVRLDLVYAYQPRAGSGAPLQATPQACGPPQRPPLRPPAHLRDALARERRAPENPPGDPRLPPHLGHARHLLARHPPTFSARRWGASAKCSRSLPEPRCGTSCGTGRIRRWRNGTASLRFCCKPTVFIGRARQDSNLRPSDS